MLWEIFVGISSFIIFFGIFIKFYFDNLEDTLMSGYIKNSVAFYKPLIEKLDSFNLLKNNVNKLIDIKKLNESVQEAEKETREYNSYYDNQLLKLVGTIILIFLAVLFLPVLLGIISYREINWTYILINFALHIVLIIIFEIILLYIIVPIYNPIEIHPIFKQIVL